MRYIDADKMRDYWLNNGENEYVYNTNAVLDSIDAQPTADVVEAKHAHWIPYIQPNHHSRRTNVSARSVVVCLNERF